MTSARKVSALTPETSRAFSLTFVSQGVPPLVSNRRMSDLAGATLASGKELVTEWLTELRDKRARARIQARIDRLEGGNTGDCFSVGEGVHELRIHYGPGYRVYLCNTGRQIVLLLCGGDKATQQADIKQAIAYKHDFEERIK